MILIRVVYMRHCNEILNSPIYMKTPSMLHIGCCAASLGSDGRPRIRFITSSSHPHEISCTLGVLQSKLLVSRVGTGGDQPAMSVILRVEVPHKDALCSLVGHRFA